MSYCPKCHGEMGATDVLCPHCGYDFPDDPEERLSPEQQAHEEAQQEIEEGIGAGSTAIVFGIALTAISYFMAEPGGLYRIWWGAMVFGIISVVGGLLAKFSN